MLRDLDGAVAPLAVASKQNNMTDHIFNPQHTNIDNVRGECPIA